MSITSTSSQQAAWKRLKKNKGAIAGLIIIILAIFTAIFSYFIAPDSSPYANRIILEIRKQKPGFKKAFLKVFSCSIQRHSIYIQRELDLT